MQAIHEVGLIYDRYSGEIITSDKKRRNIYNKKLGNGYFFHSDRMSKENVIAHKLRRSYKTIYVSKRQFVSNYCKVFFNQLYKYYHERMIILDCDTLWSKCGQCGKYYDDIKFSYKDDKKIYLCDCGFNGDAAYSAAIALEKYGKALQSMRGN